MKIASLIHVALCALILGAGAPLADAAKKNNAGQSPKSQKNSAPKPAKPLQAGKGKIIPPNVHHVRPSAASEVKNFKKLVQPGQAVKANKQTPAARLSNAHKSSKPKRSPGYVPLSAHGLHSDFHHRPRPLGHGYGHSGSHSRGHSSVSGGIHIDIGTGHTTLGLHAHSGRRFHRYDYCPPYRYPYHYGYKRHSHRYGYKPYYGYGGWLGLGPAYYSCARPVGSSAVIITDVYSPYGYSPYSAGYSAAGVADPWVEAGSTVNDYRAWQESLAAAQADTRLAGALPEAVSPPVTWEATPRQIEAVRKGWSLLAAGKAREAVTAFAIECELDPNYAPAKVGYAIASAVAGEEAAARWGMRRALAIRTDGLAYLPGLEGLTQQLTGLSQRLWSEMAARPLSADDWFFVAAVEYLRHDLQSARRAAQEAQDLGDDSPSLRNLIAQIEAEASQ